MPRSKTASLLALWVLLLGPMLPRPASAHNGAVATAVPVEGITVDGDLTDWPEGMRRYPILNTNAGVVVDPDDIQAFFRLGYNAAENALYVAVEADDQSTVIDTTEGARLDPQDGCDVFINLRHAEEDATALHQYVIWGHTRRVFRAAKLADAEVRVRRDGRAHHYEWRVDLHAVSEGRVQIAPNTVLGLDVAVFDLDADGTTAYVKWGHGQTQEAFGLRGDAVIVGGRSEIGRLRGQMTRGRGGRGVRGIARVRSVDTAGMEIRVAADRNGAYAVELPAGIYQVVAGGADFGPGDASAFEIRPQMEEQVDLVVSIPLVELGEAAEAESVAAGRGYRQGEWHSFGVQDGLSDAAVNAILQDSSGAMWFGTNRGLCRYDGESFTTVARDMSVVALTADREGNLWFSAGYRRSQPGVYQYDGEDITAHTTDDGLASNFVLAIHQDRQGTIWLGTIRGVSRYVGNQFESLSISEGGPNLAVVSIHEDAQGGLWFGTTDGLYRFDGDAIGKLSLKGALPRVASILMDRTGTVWMSTRDWGARGLSTSLVTYDGRGCTPVTGKDGLPDAVVNSMLEDRDGVLWFGTDEGLVRRAGGSVTTFTTDDGLASDVVLALAQDREGHVWAATASGVSRFGGKHLRSFTKQSGLDDNRVTKLLEGRDGSLWLATEGGGVSHFDGSEFSSYTTADGLPHNRVNDMLEDRRGRLWFATGQLRTPGGGVSRYDGDQLTTYTTENGLPYSATLSLLEDGDGNLWCRPGQGGISRLTGDQFVTLTAADGLAHNQVTSMLDDRGGGIWFGSDTQGVSRYQDGQFKTYNTDTGLGQIHHMQEDRSGNMWFSWVKHGEVARGLSRFDGERFETFTREDGLPDGDGGLWCSTASQDGVIWWGSYRGLIRFDGESFDTVDRSDGLADDGVRCILQDRSGILWVGTGNGVSRYDGVVIQNLLRRDGLVHDSVNDILEGRNGDVWIATDGGVTRYRPHHTPPAVRLERVVADQSYGPVSQIAVASTQRSFRIEFQGRSMYTPVDQMAYVYRLEGRDAEWRQTRETSIEYTGIPRGEYLFQVKAVDGDLNYSGEPATVRIIVHPPYGLIALWGALGCALVGLAVASGYGVKRSRERNRAQQERDQAREQLVQELEEELQDARRMQMSLMPATAPALSGLSIAGRCVSANHVGGDFYQYFTREGGVTVSLADVTGHAMEAAIPAVMFSGILGTRMEEPKPLQELFQSLNRSLCSTLGEHTYVCLSMVDIDQQTHAFRLANCGCPYPLHYHAATGSVSECQVEAYPLGVRQGTAYEVMEGALQPGDYLVLYSDGFPEAAGTDGGMFGFEHTASVVQAGCSEGQSPEELIERLIGEVRVFAGDEAQADDMTCVVIKAEV